MKTFKQYLLEQDSMPETITVDGVRRSTKNSNDVLIASNVKSIENFWRWFDDSEVVDEHGRPLVMYHSTSHYGFDEYELENAHETGMFFTPFDNAASTYNPSWSDNQTGSSYAVYLKIESPVVHTRHDLGPAEVEEHNDGVIYKMKEDEFGGDMISTIVVFDETQIKSAVSNSGSFKSMIRNITE